MVGVSVNDWGNKGTLEWVSKDDFRFSTKDVIVELNMQNYKDKVVSQVTVYLKEIDPNGVTVSEHKIVNNDYINPLDYDISKYHYGDMSSTRNELVVDRIEVRNADGTTESCDGNYEPTDKEFSDAAGSCLTTLLKAGLWVLLIVGIFGISLAGCAILINL